MIFKEANTTELEYLVNHPSIAEACGVPEGARVTMHGVKAIPRAVGLISILPGVTGGLTFGHLGNDVFDVHFMFIPGGSGKQMLRVGRAIIKEMFTNRGARVIRGCPPRGNRAVRVVGIALGFIKLENAEFTNAQGRICDVYEIRR